MENAEELLKALGGKYSLRELFANCKIPENTILPEGFGERAENTNSMFAYAKIEGDLTFPKDFGRNLCDASYMFAHADLRGDIDWSNTRFDYLDSMKITSMFLLTRFNGHKIYVADECTRQKFIDKGEAPKEAIVSKSITPKLEGGEELKVGMFVEEETFERAFGWEGEFESKLKLYYVAKIDDRCVTMIDMGEQCQHYPDWLYAVDKRIEHEIAFDKMEGYSLRPVSEIVNLDDLIATLVNTIDDLLHEGAFNERFAVDALAAIAKAVKKEQTND
jgi:hypothetical protein